MVEVSNKEETGNEEDNLGGRVFFLKNKPLIWSPIAVIPSDIMLGMFPELWVAAHPDMYLLCHHFPPT